MRVARVLLIAAALAARADIAQCAWTVDAAGACVRQWSSDDLLRGPTAITSGMLLPARTLAAGADYAWHKTEWWPGQIAILGPAATAFCGVMGIVEGGWWATTGLADTLTGGYFELAPEPATTRSTQPTLPLVMMDPHSIPTPTEDHCGRPLAAAK